MRRCKAVSVIAGVTVLAIAAAPGHAEPDDDPSTATPIVCGDRVQNVAIDSGGDVDFYSIALQAGQLLTVDIDAGDLGSPLDSFVRVLGTDGENVLQENDDDPSGGGGFTLDSFVTFCMPADGTYFIEISGVGDSTGLYEMLVGCEASCATCCDLEDNQPLCLSIEDCVELFGGKLGEACPPEEEGRLCSAIGGQPPVFIDIMGRLGAAADTFISPLGEGVPFDEFTLRTDVPLATLEVIGRVYTGPGAAPTVADFRNEGGGQHTLSLDRPIAPGNWLKLTFEIAGDATPSATVDVWLAHQPLDINQDETSNIRDATAFGDEFRGAKRLRLLDLNGDRIVDVRDATAFGSNWHGVPPQTAWRNTELPPKP